MTKKTEEIEKQEVIEEVPASEAPDNIEVQEEEIQEEEPKMVPLAALEAERRKRQEAEERSRGFQQQEQQEQENEDREALVDLHTLKEMMAAERQINVEQSFLDNNPEALRAIKNKLEKILEIRPQLETYIKSSSNRYRTAYEIVNDYSHLVEDKKQYSKSNDAQRMVQNSKKPRSPVEIGKSPNPTTADLLKNVQGTKDWGEVREQMRRGQL